MGTSGKRVAPADAAYALFGTNSVLTGEVDLQSMQLVNEIKGFPAYVAPDADLVTLNLWWDSLGAPTTPATFVDVAGEAGLTETYEFALKCVAAAANDGLYQRFTYADEPRVKSGRTISALVAIWSVGGISITAKLINSDATETAASVVTAAAWTLVAIEGHACGGTYVDLQVAAGAAGTFYVVPLGLSIGSKALALPPRPWRDVAQGVGVIESADPGGVAWTDADVTAGTSPLAFAIQLQVSYVNSTTANRASYVRRNGDSVGAGRVKEAVLSGPTASGARLAHKWVFLDDGQVFEYGTSGVAGDTESLSIYAETWRMWA